MRLSTAALSLALFAASASVTAQKPDKQVAPLSMRLQAQGESALAAGNIAAANDALEAAVVADPHNRAALIALGKTAQSQQLPGKAIRYYKDALQLDPNDVDALAAEGNALVQRGATDRAKGNLARIQQLCKTGCPAATELSAAIAKGPPPTVQTAQASDKVPPKGQEKSNAAGAAPIKN